MAIICEKHNTTEIDCPSCEKCLWEAHEKIEQLEQKNKELNDGIKKSINMLDGGEEGDWTYSVGEVIMILEKALEK